MWLSEPQIYAHLFFCVVMVVGIELRALHMLDKLLISALHPHTLTALHAFNSAQVILPFVLSLTCYQIKF